MVKDLQSSARKFLPPFPGFEPAGLGLAQIV